METLLCWSVDGIWGGYHATKAKERWVRLAEFHKPNCCGSDFSWPDAEQSKNGRSVFALQAGGGFIRSRSVCFAGDNVVVGNPGVLVEDLLAGPPALQEVENVLDGETAALDDQFPGHYLFVDANTVIPICHGCVSRNPFDELLRRRLVDHRSILRRWD